MMVDVFRHMDLPMGGCPRFDWVAPREEAPSGSRNVGGIDVVLGLLRLMTLEALLGGVRHRRLRGISAHPELKSPSRRSPQIAWSPFPFRARPLRAPST